MSDASQEADKNKDGDKDKKKDRLWPPRSEHVIAVLAIIVVGVLWHFKLWTFADAPPPALKNQANPGITQYLLDDPSVLALVQIAVAALAGFIAVSFVVHVWNRRWLSGLTREGWAVDARPVEKAVKEAREDLESKNAYIRRLEALLDRTFELVPKPKDASGSP